jgi:hypothetical protein
MKLCPQCEFIYEDDQKFCDMDGEVLAHDTRLGACPDTLPAVISARPTKPRLKIIGMAVVSGLALSALLSLTHYASSPPVEVNLASRSRKSAALETSQQRQTAPPLDNSSSQPATDPSQSATNPEAASESVGAEELADKPASQSAQSQVVPKPTDNSLKATDNRLTIARRLPPLPRLTPLPQLPLPPRLPAAKQEKKQPGLATARQQQDLTNQKTAMASQKTLIVEVKPTSGNATNRSRVKSFLKKTGRILKKPFQP